MAAQQCPKPLLSSSLTTSETSARDMSEASAEFSNCASSSEDTFPFHSLMTFVRGNSVPPLLNIVVAKPSFPFLNHLMVYQSFLEAKGKSPQFPHTRVSVSATTRAAVSLACQYPFAVSGESQPNHAQKAFLFSFTASLTVESTIRFSDRNSKPPPQWSL